MNVITDKNNKAAERKAKAGDTDDDAEDDGKPFTPGGILGWTRDLAAKLDQLVAGRAGASEVADTIAAEWFADRLRHGLGTPMDTPLPGITGALDHTVVPRLIATARAAEAEIDMNANDKILLAATTTMWEKWLHSDH
jgi:hypothetical protein